MRKILLLLPLLPILLVACSNNAEDTIRVSSPLNSTEIIEMPCDADCQEALRAVDRAPVPADAACTKIYGGPEEITLETFIGGERLTSSFNKQGGCEVARWETLISFLEEMNIDYEKLFPQTINTQIELDGVREIAPGP